MTKNINNDEKFNNENLKKTITKKKSFFSFTNFFKKTKNLILHKIKNIFFKKKIDSSIYHNLKEILLLADVGIITTNYLIQNFKITIQKKNITDVEEAYNIFKKKLYTFLKFETQNFIQNVNDFKKIHVFLFVGVNGVGKTSTLVKLAYFYQKKGKKVLLVAGDTFRAAAIEQLKDWGKFYNFPVFSKNLGTDPSSVIFDSLKFALIKKFDMVFIDTAGRLHNKINLMHELKKIDRVVKKYKKYIIQETILVLDACIGQNSIQQTRFFNKTLTLSNIIMTKLDGTAKGGILIAIIYELKIPIYYICVGEKIHNLVEFNSKKFIDSLF
ncbi:signal recognition particle-docking protein FtsY [Buchnera aphidicola]|uniref:signal recognition particle-docking protein FtsY n=1 Tax=Buchnera aphidicola TaxID=9 RepID=UPI0031B88ED7